MRILISLLFFMLTGPASAQNYNVNLEDVLHNGEERSFGLHLPNYILAGKDDLKLQFSFKYKILRNSNFYFGYTQKMFWEIYKDSKPFKDTNYNPEFFYRFPIKGSHYGSVDVGYLHSSNGKAGIESRSFDRFYARWSSFLYQGKFKFLSSLRLYYVLNEDPTNKDISNYVGFWDWTFYLMNLLASDSGESFDLGVNVFAGDRGYDFDRGGLEASIRYTFRPMAFNPDIMLQYYRGYLEDQLNYDQKTERIRLGFMFYF